MGTHCRHILGKPNWAPAGHAQLGARAMLGHAGHAQLGPSWACPLIAHCGQMLGMPSWAPAGRAHLLPIMGICWACPACPRLGVPTYCPLWAYAGHAQLGPGWACPAYAHMGSKWARPGTPIMAQAGALLGIVGPSFAQHGPTWACCRGSYSACYTHPLLVLLVLFSFYLYCTRSTRPLLLLYSF